VVVEGEVTTNRQLPSSKNQLDRWQTGNQHSRWDDVDTGVLDGVPSLLSDLLGHLGELLVRSLASPVRLDDLELASDLIEEFSLRIEQNVRSNPIERGLEVDFSCPTEYSNIPTSTHLLHRTVDTDTGVSEDSRLDHFG
jgi:hypothetical protein